MSRHNTQCFTTYGLCSEGALTVRSSIGFKQTETVVRALRTIGESFQHAQVRDVKSSRKQVAHLTHKFGQNHLKNTNINIDLDLVYWTALLSNR